MIPGISEHFGSDAQYATLHQATVTFAEMGDRTITTQVRIDGDHVPAFDDWYVTFKGEKFILPIKEPQAAKNNTTRNSLVDLTFYSWVTYQLKRYLFMSMSQVETGVYIPDQYNASVNLSVENFVTLFNRVLSYYYGPKIQMDLFNAGQGIYSNEPVLVEINKTYIWDVLIKFYELYGLRWRFQYDSTNDIYYIKVGYPADSIDDHDFEYGYQGGLLGFERQVQEDNINNILLGRGGEKNLPYRYFKKVDPQNPNWAADPDAIPELALANFDRLRDATFRWYVRGWMQNPNCDQAYAPYPQYSESDIPGYGDETDKFFLNCRHAFRKGKTDSQFNPVETSRDFDSIEKYGERWGALDDNDDIFPTIQGITRSPIGRIDETVAVSEIITDDIEAMAENAAVQKSINPLRLSVYGNNNTAFDLTSETFTIPTGSTGNITYSPFSKETVWPNLVEFDTENSVLKAVRVSDGEEFAIAGIPAGTYRLQLHMVLRRTSPANSATGTFGIENIVLTTSAVDADAWKPTFDIWVKNIWNTSKGSGETDQQYAERVWGPILGDRLGNEAKLVFSTGFMSISQDYEFKLAAYPVRDQSKNINGVPSEWKITLYKSDAEFDATGLYIPNATTGGKPVAGDKFYFIGIDMPHMYVTEAENRIQTTKLSSLEDIANIQPTWVIRLDKVRVHTVEDEDYGTALADRLSAGSLVKVTDPRFTSGNVLSLYVQSITYTWNEPTDDNPYLVPDIEVVLSDKVVATTSAVERIQGDVNSIKQQYVKVADVEGAVRRVAESLFLKKTGESDSSDSPTSFSSRVSSRGFRQGGIGGKGWGLYRDNTKAMAEGEPEEDGDTVLEVDRLVVRKEIEVNSLAVNQISYLGGKEIISAAKIEITKVIETDNGYVCYFDQKQNSVQNNFVVNDIAMGQVFNPDDTEQRYYRRLVTATGLDNITLSKTVKDGSGVPQVGDVLVQYGNTSSTARQYVIIRDVVGGGYERMISGLNSVSADGAEYYFAGRQSGSGPRWFVGASAGEYAEWVNGRLNIKGTLIVRNSDGTYQAMTDYMSGVSSQISGLQSQIDGQIQSWASGQAPTAQTKPYPELDETTGQITGTPNYPASSWSTTGDKEKHFGDIYIDESTGQAWRYTKNNSGYYWTMITDEEAALALQKANQALGEIAGMNYLTSALRDGTTIVQGGLVLSSLIQLGQVENGQFVVYSGMNGDLDETMQDPTLSIAAWYGGPMVDHELSPSAQNYALSLFRHDGSGYLAGGNIHWDQNGYGGVPGLSWDGTNIIISDSVQLGDSSGSPVGSLLTLVQRLYSWFGEDEAHNIYVKPRNEGGVTTPRNFYSYGAVTAGGVSSGGGGGGGVDLLRVWQSLTNNITLSEVTDTTKIHQDHIPNISWNKITQNKPTTLAGYGITDANIQDGVITLGASTITPLVSASKGTATAGGAVSYSNGALTIQFPTIVTSGRSLTDASDLFFKAPNDQGTDVTIDDETGVTGTVLWGAESTNQVALSVNGASKTLLKAAALDNVFTRLSVMEGKFVGNSAADAMRLNGYDASYFATAAGLSSVVSAIADLGTIRSRADEGHTAYNWGNHASAGYLTSVPVATNSTYGGIKIGYTSTGKNYAVQLYDGRAYVNVPWEGSSYTLPAATADTLGGIKVGSGLLINNGVLSVINQGSVSRIDVGNSSYVPISGVVTLPAYYTTTEIDQMVTNATHYRGDFAASGDGAITGGGTLKSVAEKVGDVYTVSTAGTYIGIALQVGDSLLFKRDVAAGTAPVAADVSVVQGTVNVVNEGATLTAGSTVKVATVEGVDITVVVPSFAPSNAAITIGTTSVALGSSIINLTGLGSISASGALTLTATKKIYFGDTSHYLELDSTGFHFSHSVYSDGFISAGGVGSGGGGGSIDLDRVWESLTNNTDKPNVKINVAHIPNITTGMISDLESWASGKGYLTSITSSMVTGALGFTPANSTANVTVGSAQIALNGSATLTQIGIPSWAQASSKPSYALTEISGTSDLQAIEALTGTSGFLKKTAANTWTLDTTTYATSSDLSSVAGRVSTLEGQTNWDNYFEIVNGNIHVKGNRGLYSDSFISAGGASSGGGGGGGVDLVRVWQSLTNDATLSQVTDDTKINIAHIPSIPSSKITGLGSLASLNSITTNYITDLSSWAGSSSITTLGTITTGTWHGSVIGQSYLNLSGYATEQYVDEELDAYALKTITITAGTGLSGGGTLAANRTISLSTATQTSLGKANTALQPADMPIEKGVGSDSIVGKHWGHGTLSAGGPNSFAFGHADADGATIETTTGSKGSLAFGVAENVEQTSEPVAIIRAGGYGSMAFGHTSDGEDGSGEIIASASGSFAHGHVEVGSILAEDNGAVAFGVAMDDGAFIEADAEGAVAFGAAYGLNPSSGDSACIQAMAGGSLAGGSAVVGGTINSSGSGSIAFGYVSDGGTIYVESFGAMAFGFADDSVIQALENGAHASGYAFSSDYRGIAASGLGSFAHGTMVLAEGDYSFAVGHQTTASGDGSHAEGWAAVESQYYGSIVASGQGSHAEGYAGVDTDEQEVYSITASGRGAHAEGSAYIEDIIASGEGSHAEGVGTISSNLAEHASGKFNKSNKKTTGTAAEKLAGSTIFSVGIGQKGARANAFEIMQNGDIYILGVGSYDGESLTGATTLAAYIGNLNTRIAAFEGMFEIVNGNVHVKSNRGLYSDSFLSAGGANSGGGGGGSIDIDRVWESLTNNTDKPNVKINVAHIPNITASMVSDIDTWVAGKGYLTSITSSMVTTALGYTPFNASSFTQANIESTLGISSWAMAAQKPSYTKSEVGLGNVTNDAQVKRSEMGAASGVATLGTDGKIPSSQLPSYVDDVLEYASTSAFPATGESGKIYVALDTNKTYRWSGTAYVEISASIVIGTTTGTALDGGVGTAHINNTSNPHSVTKAQVGLGNVDNLAASGYFTALTNDSGLLSITIGGTTKTLFVQSAQNASTLENHAASYFATASDLTSVAGRVSTLEGQTNWDNYFEIVNGNIHVKGNRGLYSDSFISAGGASSGGGGGGGVDLVRVWQSLTNDATLSQVTDDTKINIAHIPSIPSSKITGLGSLASLNSITTNYITDLSSWAGSSSITTLGTVTTGTWQGTKIAATKLAIDLNWTLIGNSASYDTEDYIHVNS